MVVAICSSNISIGLLLVEMAFAQRLRRAHLVHAAEAFVRLSAETHRLVEFPRQGLREDRQWALALLVVDAHRVDRNKLGEKLGRHTNVPVLPVAHQQYLGGEPRPRGVVSVRREDGEAFEHGEHAEAGVLASFCGNRLFPHGNYLTHAFSSRAKSAPERCWAATFPLARSSQHAPPSGAIAELVNQNQ